jgi:phage shock protein PspC (stress-responsive transcriptional regulator)
VTLPKRLYRRPSTGRIGGVCAGIAEYLDSDVTLVRLAWVLLSIVPGAFVGGLLAYLAAWLIVPDADQPASTDERPKRLTRSTADRRIAGVCGGLAEYLRVDATVVRLVWAVLTVVPGCIVLGVFAYAVAWFIMPLQSGAHATPGPSTGVPELAHPAQ